ncbi:MAG: hypothetical protein ACWGON_03065 [Gemmatimonadota bacterium]
MKRLILFVAILCTVVLLPSPAQAQFNIGARGKLLFPTGDFSDKVDTGWGVAATGDFTLIPLIKIRGEAGYNSFDGKEENGVQLEDLDIWSFLIGARLQLPIIYFSLDAGYYTKIDEFSLLPGLGARIWFLDAGARYKWTGENWIEVFGGVSF